MRLRVKYRKKITNLVRNVARGGRCFESFKLFLSFTKRNWHQIFNLFVCFDSLRPINNLSVQQGPVFLG